jgi:hypothetical protein
MQPLSASQLLAIIANPFQQISVAKLDSWIEQYPYLQPLHVARALQAKTLGEPGLPYYLNEAAVRTYRRHILQTLWEMKGIKNPLYESDNINQDEQLHQTSQLDQPPLTSDTTPEEQLIDRFLQTSASQKRLRPTHDTHETEFIPTDQTTTPVVTEAMARIYLAQGLTDKAKLILDELSLRNPAKSAYFASLLQEINSNSTSTDFN